MFHLHNHSSFSFLDGFGLPEQYIARLKAVGQTGMAVTDHGNIFGHRSFWPMFDKAGLKFIPGCELYIRSGVKDEKYFHLTVLASTNEGYKNLCRLVTLSNQLDHFSRRPQVSFDEVKQFSQGLILLTGCFGDGWLNRAYKEDKDLVIQRLKKLVKTGCPVYLEIQQIDDAERDFFRIVGKMCGVKCVPTLDCHYPRPEDAVSEDLALCIGISEKMSNPNRMRLPAGLHLSSEAEVLAMGFTPEEIAVTHEIADQCVATWEKLEPIRLPGAREQLVEMVKKNCGRLGSVIKNEKYRERYRYEMSVIDKLGLHTYFVIMSDVINEFKSRGVLIGPARGSSAGSLVCYLMGITELDPILHGLYFERFLDLNRKDYPDIDTDFPQRIREDVISYLNSKYGHDRIGHICSYSSYKGAGVFHDIARVYGIGLTVASELGKAIPNLINDSIDMRDILASPAVQPILAKYPAFRQAEGLEGQFRQLGQHASGYAISPVPLSEIVAQAKVKDGFVISVNKDQAENMGLLKLDILGLKTLDILQECCKKTGVKIESLYRMEPTDPKIYDDFNALKVAGVFQFEGGAVRRALKTIKVTCLGDLSFINAVARPGASNALSGNIPIPEVLRRFIYKGKYFVYQEELMAILRFLEFSWDDVTKIRKMVSKKQVVQLEEKYRSQFIASLSKHIPESQASSFWMVMLKCGEYQFNLSHAVSYSMLGYICMWFKHYYPDAFCESYFNHTDEDVKRRNLLREYVSQGYGYQVMGTGEFKCREKKVYGSLLAIKGIGVAKLEKYQKSGKMDLGMAKAVGCAEAMPSEYAPWACLDSFGNPYPFDALENDGYVLCARVWNPKDGKCFIEDARSCEKAYFDPRYVKVRDGAAYRMAVDKVGYFKIVKIYEELK